MGYMYLSFAIVGESIGDNLLKASAGFTRPVYGISALLSYGICFYFFSLSLKTINLNIAYAVWAGIGILLTAVIAFLFWKEPINLGNILGIFFIIVGVVILSFYGEN
ncbi:multidrug efflux SMR transporter [Pediococcus acidilactici]|mgnify:FL=1|uniref:DMT family transporter n=1 Tax=Pediococcus acidilactici TaxID=1254 RepID=UPI000FFB904F|nr:multidrug efflux SMR transporter [Pediococcus acidilactici]MBW4797639.1 multidrug efflux SMR transporter [Pediococcus acidilactici]MBW9306399.1 multidrug efflux SMR transporter [Pediococcus acidilactici]MCE5961928.1 multidrug efflux SMR transporter [Pediococcus acidilactici]MCW8083060.1 multidrug efflux SMR transporter [Pediococcus acidilactici]MDB8857143.1 multidrug efflux SMR transporter [Pediococcus acidilactici]